MLGRYEKKNTEKKLDESNNALVERPCHFTRSKKIGFSQLYSEVLWSKQGANITVTHLRYLLCYVQSGEVACACHP